MATLKARQTLMDNLRLQQDVYAEICEVCTKRWDDLEQQKLSNLCRTFDVLQRIELSLGGIEPHQFREKEISDLSDEIIILASPGSVKTGIDL